MRLKEFAPSGGGGSGDYFQALASAWYNGVFDTGSLQKGIKSQQDVERLLNRGIVCPDGKTRKLHIDYNSDFDGVEIYSDDYYEYGDHDDTIDSRTGQKWGPYDFMAFSDEDLSEGAVIATTPGSMDPGGAVDNFKQQMANNTEIAYQKAQQGSLNEFSPDDSGDGSEEDALRNYARMWWAGDEATQMQIERALAKMGWEIGEDEGGYDNGGVFVVRAGDENGNSYQSWAAEDLTEDWKSKLAGAALAGAMALGAGGAHARVGADYVDNPDINRLTGKPKVTQVEPGTEQPVAAVKKGPGFSAEYLKSVIDGTHPRPLISKERAQELLQQQQQTTNEQGVAEGNDPWGPEGRFVGDTGPAQITNTVPRVQLRIGDRVLYKPTEQRATIEALSKDGTKARIHIPSPMGGRIFNCRVADLKALGQGLIREKSTSQAQFRTMAAAAHDPKFARKVGIKQSVAREFNKADKGQSYKSLPKRAD